MIRRSQSVAAMLLPLGILAASTLPAQEAAADPTLVSVEALIGKLTNPARRDSDALASARVIEELATLRSRAVIAVPVLLECLQAADPHVVAAAVHALGEIGPYASEPEAIVGRIAVHAFPGPAIRGEARFVHTIEDVGRTFQRLRVDPRTATSDLIALLQGDQPFGREFAAELLAERHDPKAIDALRQALVDEHPIKCRFSWKSEGSAGSFSCRVDVGEPIRAAAARALVATAPQRAEAAPGYTWLLRHGALAERRDAAMAVGRLGARADEVVDALCAALDDADVQVLREAITSLSALGPAAAPATARLRELRTHSDEQIRRRADAALRQIER